MSGCKGCGGNNPNAAYLQEYASNETTVWIKPASNLKFSQKKIIAPSGRRYIISSNTQMLEILAYDLRFMLGWNKRGVYHFQQVNDQKEIDAFLQQQRELLEAEQAEQEKRRKILVERHEVNQKGRVAQYLWRFELGEVSFAEVNQQIRQKLESGDITQSEVNSQFREAYEEQKLSFQQVLTQIPFENAKLFATTEDLLEHVELQKKNGSSDKEIGALLENLLATTALTDEHIVAWVQEVHSAGLIGKTIAKQYIEVE